MTTIVWYDGIFYSDSRCTTVPSKGEEELVTKNGRTYPKEYHETTKIFQHNGIMYAGSGNVTVINNFYKQMTKQRASRSKRVRAYYFGTKPNKTNVLRWDGERLDYFTSHIREIKLFKWSLFKVITWSSRRMKTDKGAWWAIGSGTEPAVAAYYLGLTPKECIQYASDRDPYTDENVVEMKRTYKHPVKL